MQAKLVGQGFDDRHEISAFTIRHPRSGDRYGIEVRTKRPHPRHPASFRQRAAWSLLAHAVIFRTVTTGDDEPTRTLVTEVRDRVHAIPAAPTVVAVDGERLEAVLIRDEVSRTWIVGVTTVLGDHVDVVGTDPVPERIRLRQADPGEHPVGVSHPIRT